MPKTKKVRFDFFYSGTIDVDGNNCSFDLTELINDIYELPVQQRSMSLQGETVKIDNVLTYDNGQTYFHMSRFRDEGLATGTIDSDDIEDMPLDEDQYIIEDIGCLFDPTLSCLMIQRNTHSLSVTGVRDYLSNMYLNIHNTDQIDMTPEQKSVINNFEFDFVPDVDVFGKVQRATRFRTIQFKAGSLEDDEISPELVRKLIGPFNKIKNSYGGYKVNITISAEPHGENLDMDSAKEFKNLVQENQTMFSSAIIRAAEGDAPVEAFDLINGRLLCYDKFNITRTDNITNQVKKIHLDSSAVEESMNRMYNLRDYGFYQEKVRQGVLHN